MLGLTWVIIIGVILAAGAIILALYFTGNLIPEDAEPTPAGNSASSKSSKSVAKLRVNRN